MKSGGGRFFYELIFWVVVCTLAYLNRNLYNEVEGIVEPIFQAYSTVVMFLLCIVLFLLVNYLREAIVNTIIAITHQITGNNPLNYDKGNLQTNIQRSAKRLERKGDFQGAGEAFESLELWREAAMVYERGKLYGKAAAAWSAAGNHGKAIELYEKDFDHEAAGNLCLSEGLQDRAAKNFRIAGDRSLEANQFVPAADFYERAHDYNKAGHIFEQAHKHERALYCFEKANNSEKLRGLIHEISLSDYHRRGADFTNLIQRCAECLAAAGATKEAAKIFEDCNNYIRAAEIHAANQSWEKSSELYLMAGRKDLVSATIKNIEDKKIAADITARLAIAESNWQLAGENFEEAGKQNQAIDAYKKTRNFEAAARIYESMGRYIMAGEMYSSSKNLTAAANAYAKAYDWRNAAECFEASGDVGQAIEAYSNAGNYLKAGTMSIKMTDYARAIEYLQRIPSASPDFQMGTAFLATAFYYQCHYDMSHELFERVMDDLPLNKETLPVYYAYASNLENENPKKALGLFRQILGIDIHHSDVSDRIQRLEKIVTSMSTGFGSNTPIPTVGKQIARQTPLPQHTPPPPAFGKSPSTSVAPWKSPSTQALSPTLSTPSGFLEVDKGLIDGRYQLGDQINNNGRIADYNAMDTLTNRMVMVRTFPRPDDLKSLQKTLNSLSSLTQLSHPNVNSITNYGESAKSIFTVSPQVEGSNLRQWTRVSGPMSLTDLRLFCAHVLNALSYIHSQNHYHQNLRPELIYIPKALEDQVIISGFGTPGRTGTAADSIYLTVPDSDPQFLAPEQIIGTDVDERTDIYAMGLIIFFALTGRTPFEVKRINDTQEIARMQVQVSLARPSTIRATLPTAVDEIFQRCVNKSSALRYQSAKELLTDIEGLQTNQSSF